MAKSLLKSWDTYPGVGPCDGVTGACGNDGCKDGWAGIACNESKLPKDINAIKNKRKTNIKYM